MVQPNVAHHPFGVEVPMRWGDMDAFGHVNNVAFHRYLEEARILAFAEWFEGWTGGAQDRPVVLLARQEVEYLAQLHYGPRPVFIEMWVSDVGGASWDLGYEMRSGPDSEETLYLRAESTIVAFDVERQRPRSLTDHERTVLGRYTGEPVAMRRRR